MRNKLPSDPIIEELHAIRRTLAAECNDDLLTIVKRAMKKQRSQQANLGIAKFVSPANKQRSVIAARTSGGQLT